ERHEEPLGGPADDVEERRPLLGSRRDVEERHLIGAVPAVGLGQLHRIAPVAQVDEPRPLPHPPGVDVEAGDDARREHQPSVTLTEPLRLNTEPPSASASRSARPSALNAHSMTWCRFRPRSTRRWTVAPAFSAKL